MKTLFNSENYKQSKNTNYIFGLETYLAHMEESLEGVLSEPPLQQPMA